MSSTKNTSHSNTQHTQNSSKTTENTTKTTSSTENKPYPSEGLNNVSQQIFHARQRLGLSNRDTWTQASRGQSNPNTVSQEKRPHPNGQVTVWGRFANVFGTDGNVKIFSRAFKIGIFPIILLAGSIYSIVNPSMLKQESLYEAVQEYESRKEEDSWFHKIMRSIGLADNTSEVTEYERYKLEGQKESLKMELMQRETAAVRAWREEHGEPNRKERIRIRNQIVREMEEEYFGGMEEA